jgi:uncharacterized protein YfkK (UPF0435 family)
MKNLIIITALLCSSTLGYSQQYDIKPAEQRINSKKHSGVSSQVDGNYLDVEKYWLDYLKENGKVRRKRNYYEVTDFSVKDLGVDTVTYVTRVESVDSLGLIWIAPFENNLDDDVEVLTRDLERILKIATRGYYVSQVQDKIDESEEAAIIVSKNHQKLIYNGENLSDDLESAVELKAQLEARLEETILKIKVLNQQILDNDEAIMKAYSDLEMIKKVIEGQKADLKKIN